MGHSQGTVCSTTCVAHTSWPPPIFKNHWQVKTEYLVTTKTTKRKPLPEIWFRENKTLRGLQVTWSVTTVFPEQAFELTPPTAVPESRPQPQPSGSKPLQKEPLWEFRKKMFLLKYFGMSWVKSNTKVILLFLVNIFLQCLKGKAKRIFFPSS